MKDKHLRTTLLLLTVTITNGANILAILPMASPSHHIWTSPLVKTLATKGHNITVVSPQAHDTKIPNLTDLEVTGLMAEMGDEDNYDGFIDLDPGENAEMLMAFTGDMCEKTMKSEAWRTLMNYPSETIFDLVIIEATGAECLIGSIQKFGMIPPIVVINAFNVPSWMMEMVGTPNVISHIPNFFSTFTDQMSFQERVTNLYYTIRTYYFYHYQYVPRMDQLAKEFFGDQIQSVQEIVSKKVSLGLANFHPVLDYAWATTPNLIPVAGIQLRDPQPLPQDIQKFLDQAEDGVIYFSLGSNIRSEKLSSEMKKAILEAFATLPQKVLWKFESDNLPGQPANVKIGKWLPQSDILAHPNVKLFITHSGLLSTHETIHRGVPVLGIPFFADQPININRMVNFGAGLRLDYKDITKDSLAKAIKSLLENPSYRENMKSLSKIFRDGPEGPLDRAVFWIEYVIKHNGAYHMRSAALDLNIVQYLLLDVIAVMLTIPVLLSTVLYCIFCRRKSKERKKIKKN